MPHVFQGNQPTGSARYAIVVSRYNESITGKLLNGALETFQQAGVADDQIDVAWVPGAWELPVVAGRLAESRRYQAVICLGAVVRGETSHDQHINRAVSLALSELAMQTGLPILFGLLTVESIEQAIHRAGGNMGNKGAECAQAALEMVSLMEQLPNPTSASKSPLA